jgi:tRNA threonylcarbamoyladenosine biosynthesis protein TsaE
VTHVLETDGPAETESVGAELAGLLAAGDVVLVDGELGTGKTTLVRGACRALGVEGPVTSPTFAIGNRYSGAGGLVVAHVDLYRVGNLADEDPDLLAEYIDGHSVAFVEWPGEAGLGAVRLRVALTHLGEDRRRIEVRG